MYCSGCGNKIEGETNLCPKCGKEVLKPDIFKANSILVKTVDRPLGLVLTVLYCAFSGIMSLILGVPLLALASQVPSFLILSLVSILFGVFYLAMCYGLWTSQGWGIPFSLKILYLSIPLSIISLFIPNPGSYSRNKEGTILITVIGIIVTVIIIQYLKNHTPKKQT